ncbi:nucleotidyltransferase family protein [Sulfitobacter sp. S0837]|uniref:nucleotidyltransferase family protein n=1 Tax=Sulfitobacter maritimus TaxID=2741719 RepID=UPI00158437C9|nr:nucleotidyltransferase family protein [Sulfitobacter maritimus]NUH66957.1 nucleotidyltransferase family protein [Sulfitobacter maritimus]
MRDQPDAIMMFAAGFGTRMKHLTQTQPKPMVPLAGRPLIDHALKLAQDIAPRKIVANLHYLPEQLDAHLRPLGVATILETPDILDTGGGLRNALPLLGGGPVFTMNSDAIWAGPNPLTLLRDAWEPNRMDALLMTVPLSQTLGHEGKGDFAIGQDGRLTRGPGNVYGGVQIIKTDLLTEIDADRFSLNILWDIMLQREGLFGLPYPGRWCDVGHPGGIALAESLLAGADV